MSADSDFQARRTAAGVVYSNGFDSAGDLADGSQEQAGDTTIQSALDTNEKTSGSSSLRFKLRAGITDANIAGAWSKSTQSFGAGDDVYYQWRQKFDSNWLSAAQNRWNSSYKATNFHGQSSTCQGSEFTFLLGTGETRSDMYTNCGDGFPTSATLVNNWDPITIGGGDGLINQGSVHDHVESTPGSGYNCHYQNQFVGDGNGEGCLYLDANVWYTFYVHVKLNTFGGSSGNNLEAYVAWNDGAYRQIHHVTNFSWNNNLDNFINRFRLETYMTELPSQGLGALNDCFTYYDELIISTQPIAAPNSAGGGAGRALEMSGFGFARGSAQRNRVR